MSDIPSEVCYEILLRVPAEPLFRFRSVCKAWRRIIDDIAFVKMHLHYQEGGDQLVIRNDTGKLYLLPLSSLDCSRNHTITIELTNIKNLVGLGVPRILSLPVPSHGGLILITHKDEREVWTLWNPFTQESFELPLHNHLMGRYRGRRYPCCGIGYDSTTDDFKVVRILQLSGSQDSCMLQTLIYSLKSNYWKSITNFHDCRKPEFATNGVFVNGALHWIADIIPQGGTAAECIIAFDLSTEEDRVLPWPSFSFLSPENFLSDFTLDVLGGCLCLRNSRVIWIMKDYGENVWTKLVSSTQLSIGCTMGKPIAYIKSKEQVLFQHNNSEFFLFDVEKKCAKKFSIEFFPGYFTSQVFPSSLFRLNRSGGGDGSIASKGTLKRKRKTANNRFKVELKISDVESPPSPSDYSSASSHGGY